MAKPRPRKPRPDKFGSPYDPNNGGKIQRPMSLEQQAQHQRQYQTRSCVDPDCAICNPETTGRGLSRPVTVSISDINSIAGFSDIDMGRTNEIIERYMRESVGRYFFETGPSSRPTPKAAPAAFTAAREAVKQWLLQAPDQAFDDIVGNEEALQQLKDAIQAPVIHKELYAAYGMKMPKGALLSGPPGCGKTMFARAAASEMRRLYAPADPKAPNPVEFICLSGAELQTMYVGETEARIKALFTFAREYKAYRDHPLLIFIDEADAILPDRTGRVRRVAPWEESQVATFLAEMDGVRESGAFVLLATNRPEVIDSAVLRDGRCDFKVAVQRPTREATEAILRKNFQTVLIPSTAVHGHEDLVFAALESLYDPHRVLMHAHILTAQLKADGWDLAHATHNEKHFLLEHIISGAMAAALPQRATRIAFTRDKATPGAITGVTPTDVVKAVDVLFAENQALDHSFALQEFQQQFLKEVQATQSAVPTKQDPDRKLN